MIVRPRPHFLQLFFILRGSIVPRIYPGILATAALSALVAWLHQSRPGLLPNFSGGPFALIGIALSIFLGFRNSACYDRWWEARRQWGELVAASRSFARQTMILPPDERRRLLTLAIAFAQALAVHLRPGADVGKATRYVPPDALAAFQAGRNPPDVLLGRIGALLAGLRGSGAIGDIAWQALDQTVARMTMVQAACERLRGTPVPFGYTLLLHRTAYLFCILLPFGFADSLGWGTPLAAGLVAYAFFGLDALGDELEQPFGDLPNDVPIAALADTLEANLREAMGETDLPAPPVPRDFVLM